MQTIQKTTGELMGPRGCTRFSPTSRLSLILMFLFPVQILQAQLKNGLSSFTIAKQHGISMDKPAPDFFEGALLGNGGMGVVVTTRPDAVVLYFGHNNVWDIRIAENHKEEIRDFRYVFDKVKALPDTLANLTDDPWYNSYNRMSADNYSKPYPRPFPCGSVVLSFDRRKMQLLGHHLDISTGVCTVYFLSAQQQRLQLRLFTDMEQDQLLMELVDEQGRQLPNLFERIKVMPDPSTPATFPKHQDTENLPAGLLSFKQILPIGADENKPYSENAKDKAFRLTVQVNASLHKQNRMNWNGNEEAMPALEAALDQHTPFVASIHLQEGFAQVVSNQLKDGGRPDAALVYNTLKRNIRSWQTYWEKSAVKLGDTFLEEIWYRNLYFLNCATKPGVTCPGLFANWSYDKIGTAWHGDYHMNYNTQQPFWVTFSSNHLEKNLPYVSLIESLMPVSRNWAKSYYGLPGAYFPHSAYPVEMTMNPYPIPDWGWEVSETPWAVQGLWWHYLYSADRVFLQNRAYEPIKAAVEFLAAYMKRPEAQGGERWQDDRFHIFPTVPPELYGLRPGFKYNYDGTIDLTLTRFIFKAFQQATKILGTTAKEKVLLDHVSDILAHFPEYPTAVSKTYGKILVAVPGEHDQVVYNVPNALITVFPGEDYGLHSDPAIRQLVKNTYQNQQNEGGNDLVFINLQAARAGLLNLEEFKRHVRYSLLPNGTATDMVMQTGGRYQEQTDYGYMSKMGIWFENFALPVVINECLMQSYQGTVRLFPNWPKNKDAAFKNLRAAGAFLISTSQKNGRVDEITILSEKGSDLRLIVPWGASGTIVTPQGSKEIISGSLHIKTRPGEQIKLYPRPLR
jgi:alpha-L-fucosidase 2